MPSIKIKGNEIIYVPIRDSATRRAVQIGNKIIETLGRVGLTVDDIDVVPESMPMRKAAACVKWYADGNHCLYSFSRAGAYIDNLQVVFKVIETHVNEVANEQKTMQEFIADFTEETDVEDKRKEARALLGVSEDSISLDEIDSAFKKLSRTAHPDMPSGNTEEFKKINEAHKTLRRELG